jgi:putative spermidine/putrescine transport system permease protein
LPAAITSLYLGYLLAPMLLLALGSVGATWSNTPLPTGGLTARWYVEVWSDRSFRLAFSTSLQVAAATVVICAVLGAPLAYVVASAASRGVRLAARIAWLLPVAAPPIVLAFGLLLVFSSDTLPYLGESWVLVGGHVVLCLPYLLQALVADMRHMDLPALERAADSLGAGFRRRFTDIVLPALRHSLLTGSVAVAALSIGEFQLSNLIAGFLNRTYPVVLLQAFYGATGFACAATVVLLALALIAAATGALAARGAAAAKGIAG